MPLFLAPAFQPQRRVLGLVLADRAAIGRHGGLGGEGYVRYCQHLWASVPQKDKDAFAAKLKKWRERRGLSQSQAATELGVNLDTLQNWEIARTMPRGIGLRALMGVIAGRKIE